MKNEQPESPQTAESDEQRHHFNRERLKEEAAMGIYAAMERDATTRAQLAEMLGKSRAFITKILEGDHNFTLETLADVYGALGRAVHFYLGADLHEFRLPMDEAVDVSHATTDLSLSSPMSVTFSYGEPETLPGAAADVAMVA